MGIRETPIQAEVIKYLRSVGLVPHRINSGLIKRKYRMAPKGWPDVTVVLPPGGRLLGLEVKAPGGTREKSQEAMETILVEAGAAYHVVTSVDDVKAVLEEVGYGV